jgi:ATP-dependent DNA helicase
MYHGTPEERAELRRTVMPLPVQTPVNSAKKPGANSGKRNAMKNDVREAPPKKKRGQSKRKAVPPRKKGRRSTAKREEDQDDQTYVESVDHEQDVVMESLPESEEDDSAAAASFPVVITTYEMIIKDRVHLSAYEFSYIGLLLQFFRWARS